MIQLFFYSFQLKSAKESDQIQIRIRRIYKICEEKPNTTIATIPIFSSYIKINYVMRMTIKF